MEGNYQLKVLAGLEEGTLLFSFLIFKDKEVPIGNQTEINIFLTEDLSSLDEVVIIGYEEQRKSSVTDSIATIQSEGITDVPAPTVSQALIGKLAGVTMSRWKTGRGY